MRVAAGPLGQETFARKRQALPGKPADTLGLERHGGGNGFPKTRAGKERLARGLSACGSGRLSNTRTSTSLRGGFCRSPVNLVDLRTNCRFNIVAAYRDPTQEEDKP